MGKIITGADGGGAPALLTAAEVARPRAVRDPAARFWEHVEKTGDCWLWTAKQNGKGYGKFTVGRRSLGQRRDIYAHRFAYELLVGSIPDGLQLDHLCRVRNCVNPAHLEPVTPGENTRRGGPASKTRCDYGHEFTPENTYRQPSTGRRSCLKCRRLVHRRTAIEAMLSGQDGARP